MLEITLTWVSGYRRSHRGRDNAPFIRSITHAPDQTYIRLQHLHCLFDLATPSHLDYGLALGDFHGVSRAEGPSQLTWKSATRRSDLFPATLATLGIAGKRLSRSDVASTSRLLQPILVASNGVVLTEPSRIPNAGGV